MTISMLKNFYRWACLVALPYSLTVATPLLAVEDVAPVTNHHQSSAAPKKAPKKAPKNISCATGHTPTFSEPRERFLGQLAELAQREDYFYYVGWSAGGEHALTYYSNEQEHNILSITNTATAQETTKIVYESEDYYTAWSWHPTQQLLATIHSIPLSDTEKVGVLSVVDVKGEAQSITFPLSPFEEDMGIAFFQVDWSPNGQYLAVSTEQAESIGFSFGDVESFIHMFTYQNDSLVRTASLEFPFPLKPDIEWSVDSRYFVALGGRRTSFNPIIFDVLNNTEVVAPEAMNRGVRKVDIHPNSRYLLERYGYGAGILDLETGEIISNLSKENGVVDIGWGADGQKIAMLIYNDQARAISPSHNELIILSGTGLTSEPIYQSVVDLSSLLWSPNSKYLLSLDEQERLILIDTSFGEEFITPLDLNANIYASTWSFDSEYIAFLSHTTNNRKFINIVEAETGSKIQTLELSEDTHASDVQWSPDNQFLSIDGGTPVNVFDLSNLGHSCD